MEILRKRIESLNKYGLAKFEILRNEKRMINYLKISVGKRELIYPANVLEEEVDGISNYVRLCRKLEDVEKIKKGVLNSLSITIISEGSGKIFKLDELVYRSIIEILGSTNSSLDVYLPKRRFLLAR